VSSDTISHDAMSIYIISSYINMLISIALKIRNFINRHPTTPRLRLAMTLVTRNEADILERFLEFNKAMGVDFFVVTDNGSTDRTPEILRKYEQSGWIAKTFTDMGPYTQLSFVDRMIRYISDNELAEWVVNSDTDEFWVPLTGTLKDKLARSRANVISCRLNNVVPLDQDDPMHNILTVVKPDKINAGKLSIFSPNYNKVIHRIKGYSLIHQGNHNVDIRRKSVEITEDIFVLHYAVRSFNHFKSKFENLMREENLGDHAIEYKRRRQMGESPEEIFHDYLHFGDLKSFRELGYLFEISNVRDFFFDGADV
jgi:glycosyltransferase involved in cell wall biosynthesis